MSSTPGVPPLAAAISTFTFFSGSCPPSPGFAPCPIFISISSNIGSAKYPAQTPNLPDANCFILEALIVPKRDMCSPPSPEFDNAPTILVP